MAKLTLSTLATGLASIAKMNQNFADIVSEFQNKVLYRNNPSGEPNQMENDLDMNSNAVLNVSTLEAQAITLQGSPLVYADLAVLASEEDYTATMAGAVGDGVTDDTAAIQAALDLCLATGRRLRLGNAVYAVSTLTVTVNATDKGPLIIEGHGGPQNFSNALGTQLVQIAGTTGSLLTITADFAANYPAAGDYLTNVQILNLGLKTSSDCTGWAIDARNITTSGNEIRNVNIYTPGSSSAGGIRLNSCWSFGLYNVTCTGPAAGSTSRGIVIYGSNTSGGVTRGTCNQIRLDNVRANYYAKCNVQLGKWDSSDNTGEGTGGFMHSILWTGGQAGASSAGYGIVFGRVLDVQVLNVHTENNYKSGWYFDDDPSGTDCGDITISGCDSYNDGDDGAYVDAADRYGIQVNRGTQIKIDGFRFQMTRYGIYVSSSSDVDAVDIDRVRFTAHTSGGSVAMKLQSATPSTSRRVRLGMCRYGGTWTYQVVNGEALGTLGGVVQGPTTSSISGILAVDPMQDVVHIVQASPETINVLASSVDQRTWPNGKTFRLVFTDSNATLADVASGGSASFKLQDGKDFNARTGDSVLVSYKDGEWWEVSRQYRSTTAHSAKTHTTGTTVEVTNLTRTVTLDPSGALTITDFTGATNRGPVEGQRIQVIFADANTTLEDNNSNASAKFYLEDNRNFNGNTQDVMELTYRSGYWYEVSRKYNGNPTTHNTVTHTSGGTITVTNLTKYIIVNLGANTNITDLVSATGRAAYTGQRIFITNNDGTYSPTFKDISGGAYKFILSSDTDKTLNYSDTMEVYYDGTNWRQLGYNNN